MDFSRLGKSRKKKAPINPIEIFESLPSLVDTPNDLWRGQDKALASWHAARDKQDVLVSLNTGAGKTIVGLLIAQSLVNEEIHNVIYVCSTIDLVQQTAEEAKRIGIDHTLRIKSQFSNDLFETGKGFCITTYAALFNGHSALRRKHFPGAIVFDDAHVAENLIRDAFTIRIDIREHEDLFNEIAKLFRPHFKHLGAPGKFRDALDLSRQSTAFVAPNGLYGCINQLLETLYKHGVKDHQKFTYAFAWLEDHLNTCAATFTRGIFELTPPFLPCLALDVFEQNVRRVYLSATLESQTDFVRAFGRKPDKTIVPSNDAGNGERLIISGQNIEGGFGPEFAEILVEGRKAIVAVPDYGRAKLWENLVEAPTTENFSKALNEFRKTNEGAFLLVSRVDGIDLPHETCRIMIIDGIPSGSSLLERFQWEFLRMNNVHAVRIANRLAQLFGRINRGRNDYGAFLIRGDQISKWLSNDRNLALLPPLLQRQILIGREVQTEFEIRRQPQAIELVDRVLGRDEGWLDYYQREVELAELDQDQLKRHKIAEPVLVDAALSEAKYAAAMWGGDPKSARLELEKTLDETALHDTPLGGWHALWVGAAYDLEGNNDEALIAYGNAMRRLGRSLVLPRIPGGDVNAASISGLNSFGRSLWDLVSYTDDNKFEKEIRKFRNTLSFIDKGTSNQAEAGVRALGELLGYTATRPDNDEGTGPDVLWCDEVQKRMIGFELKTDKDEPATYFKKEISQGHDHIEWMGQKHRDYALMGLIYVGPEGMADKKANPSTKMGLCIIETMVALRRRLFALIEDLRNKIPLERCPAITEISKADEWNMEAIFEGLCDKVLAKVSD